MTESVEKPDVAAKSIRSPSYPSMPLGEAVEAVRKIETPYRSAPVDRADAAKLLGYSAGSGPANKALADLAAFGLIERAGKGELRVTLRAKAILYPNSEEERRRSIEAAAFDPQLFKDLRERFGNIVPPEDGIATFLARLGFNQSAIRPAQKAYLGTLAYLEQTGASESHSDLTKSAPKSEGSKPDVSTKFGGAKVGDLIQWESSGALQLEKPMRVRAVSDDGQWVAVEGSETGIPMSEVIVEESFVSSSHTAPPVFKLKSASAPSSDKPNDIKIAMDGGKLNISCSNIDLEGLATLRAQLEMFENILKLAKN